MRIDAIPVGRNPPHDVNVVIIRSGLAGESCNKASVLASVEGIAMDSELIELGRQALRRRRAALIWPSPTPMLNGAARP
jgi:hypothetical protein